MDMSDYMENTLLTYMLTNDLFVGLFTADPTETGELTEVTALIDANYARQLVTFDILANVATSNLQQVFPSIGGVSYDVTHFGIFDTDGTTLPGNLWMSKIVPNAASPGNPVTRITGQSMVWATGDISITFD